MGLQCKLWTRDTIQFHCTDFISVRGEDQYAKFKASGGKGITRKREIWHHATVLRGMGTRVESFEGTGDPQGAKGKRPDRARPQRAPKVRTKALVRGPGAGREPEGGELHVWCSERGEPMDRHEGDEGKTEEGQTRGSQLRGKTTRA